VKRIWPDQARMRGKPLMSGSTRVQFGCTPAPRSPWSRTAERRAGPEGADPALWLVKRVVAQGFEPWVPITVFGNGQRTQ
jgi:hypothetical protein